MGILFKSGSGIGGLSQYVLGKQQNVFGTLTERDNYATANPSWLQSYDNNPLTTIKVGDTFYNRVDGAWNDLTFLIGVAGDSQILSQVSSWNYPVKQPDGTFADGELTLNPTTMEVSTPATFRTGVSQGIKLKDTHAISSVGENISFPNLVSDIPFTIGAWSDGSYSEDWLPTARVGLDSFLESIIQPVFDTTIINPDFISPATGNRRTYGFYYKGATPLQKVKIEIYQGGKEIFESKYFDIVAGDGFVSFEVAGGGSGFADLKAGIDYQVIFKSDNGNVELLGNSTGVPYLALKYQSWEDKELAFKEDVNLPARFSGYMSNISYEITNSEETLPIDTINLADNVTVNSGVFTVGLAGFYEGLLTFSMRVTGQNKTMIVWVERFSAGQWLVVPRSLASIEISDGDTGLLQISSGVSLQTGQSFRIRTKRVGGGTITLEENTATVSTGVLTQNSAAISFRRTSDPI